MNDHALAAGRAARATLRWLHRRPVKVVSLHHPINHAEDPPPQNRSQIEEAVRIALAPGAGEMLHLGADATHLQHDTSGVADALGLARKLPGRDPVDVLEEQLDHVCSTLCSPRIWRAVSALAGALASSPGGELRGDEALRVIEGAVRDPRPAGVDHPMHPRKILIRTPSD
jgi:hypothetical protein